MNKSLITNLFAASLCAAGYLMPENAWRSYVLGAGLFSLSGALTNWIAVHMLFERVPGLYGSGVILERFEEFKSGIHRLVMDNFFTEENFANFADQALHQGLTPEAIHEKVDMDSFFDGFLDVVGNSKFGGMLVLVGGLKALEPLREPFKVEFESRLNQIIDNLDLTKSGINFETLRPQIDNLVKGRLDSLKPVEVKEIVEKIIRQHLGWLVVWGGFFGALLGIVAEISII